MQNVVIRFVISCLLFFNTCYSAELFIFTADWCPSCVKLKNFLYNNGELFGKHDISFIDIDENIEQKESFNVKKIPTTIVLENGIEINRKVGYDTNYKNWILNLE